MSSTSTSQSNAISALQRKHGKWQLPLLLYTAMFSLYLAYLPRKYVWFSWHPFFMLVAFVLLAGNAVLIKKIGGKENTINHGYLMCGACVSAALGFYVIYTNKNMFNKAHFQSGHAQLGLVALGGYTGLAMVGFLALHPDFGVLKTNQLVRFMHKWGGRAMTAVAWVTCVLGFIKMEHILWKQVCFGLPLLYAGFAILL